MKLPLGWFFLARPSLTERWGDFSPIGQNVTRKTGQLGVNRTDEPTGGFDFWSYVAG
jgi:hypothetical protein